MYYRYDGHRFRHAVLGPAGGAKRCEPRERARGSERCQAGNIAKGGRVIRSNRFALATIDALQAHICVLDEHGVIVAVNRAWQNFALANLPAPHDAAEGASYLDVCDRAAGPYSEEAPLFAAGIRAVLSGERESFVLEYPCHSPEVKRWFIGRVTRLAKDEPNWVVVMHEDITRLKESELALQESEAKYRGITQRSFDAIFLTDLEGRAVYVSPATERLVGEASENLIGRHFREFVVEPDLPQIVAAFGRIAEGGAPEVVEAQVRRADGSFRFVEATGAPIVTDGRLAGVQVIARDVTQRKEAEDKLRRMEAQMMHTARLSAMGEMVASIAHEVSQPLFSILNYAKAIQNLLAGDEPPPAGTVRDWNGEILASASRAGEIIARLRNFVRRAENDRRQPVRIGTVIEESLAMVAHDLRRHEIEASLDLPAADAVAVVDRIQIQQVLVNLLRNACDALEDADCPRRVTISARLAGPFLEITVHDNGPGVAGFDSATLFEPFFTTKPLGVGVGLAISRTIIEAHDGELWVDDAGSPGATFRFTLPVSSTEPTITEPADAERTNDLRRG